LEDLKGRKVLAFAGLANPGYFLEILESLGATLVGHIVFPDHHRYTEGDLGAIRKTMSHAEWVVTTEKDMVRLEGLGVEGLPLRVLQIKMHISDEDAFKRALFAGLGIEDTLALNQNTV